MGPSRPRSGAVNTPLSRRDSGRVFPSRAGAGGQGWHLPVDGSDFAAGSHSARALEFPTVPMSLYSKRFAWVGPLFKRDLAFRGRYVDHCLPIASPSTERVMTGCLLLHQGTRPACSASQSTSLVVPRLNNPWLIGAKTNNIDGNTDRRDKTKHTASQATTQHGPVT